MIFYDRIFRLINEAQQEPDPIIRKFKFNELRKLEQKLRRGKG